jgi:hypothetical protein
VAGLAVFSLVPSMTVTSALQKSLATLVANKHARGLPLPQTSMDEFKDLIGFGEIGHLQEHNEMR